MSSIHYEENLGNLGNKESIHPASMEKLPSISTVQNTHSLFSGMLIRLHWETILTSDNAFKEVN